MAFSEFEQAKIKKETSRFIERKRPAPHIRHQVDISFRLENQSVVIFEVRARWDNPSEKIESPVAKATYFKTKEYWKVYCQRRDLKWHKYDPMPEVKSLQEFLDIVENDKHTIFWG